MRSVPTARGRTRGLNGITEAEGSAEVPAPRGASEADPAVLFTALGQHLAKRQEQGCLAEGSSRGCGGGHGLSEDRSRPCAPPQPPLSKANSPKALFTLPARVNPQPRPPQRKLPPASSRPAKPSGSSPPAPKGRPPPVQGEDPARAPGSTPRPEVPDSLLRPGEPWARGCGAGRPRPAARRWPAASPGPTRWAPGPRARPWSRPAVPARPGAHWARASAGTGRAAPFARPDLSNGPGPAPCRAAAALSAPPGGQLSHRIQGRTDTPTADGHTYRGSPEDLTPSCSFPRPRPEAPAPPPPAPPLPAAGWA